MNKKICRLLLASVTAWTLCFTITGCSYEMDTLFDEQELLNISAEHNGDYTVGTYESSAPVDIIMAIDNSGSMSDEIAKVKDNITLMSTFMENAGIDYHFIMISRKGPGDYEIIVPEPMAGLNGADTDKFIHLNQYVGSWDTFNKIIDNFPGYRHFLRENSILNFIVVTDDDPASINNANYVLYEGFKNEMARLGRDKFVMHGIIGLDPNDVKTGEIAAVGEEFIKGIDETGGKRTDIASNSSWDTILLQISDSIVNVTNNIFILEEYPVRDTIRVSFGGKEQVGNWEYSEQMNAVIMNSWNGIQVGDSLTIEYVDRGTLVPVSFRRWGR